MGYRKKLTNKKLEYLPYKDLTPYEKNSRIHSEKQIEQIANSIKEFGFTNPILIDSTNGIIAGHGRYEAAIKLGIEKLPCIRLDHLSEVQKRAYIIADNRLAESATWDGTLLSEELASLKEQDLDLDAIGLGLVDFEDLNIPELDGEGLGISEPNGNEDEVPEVEEENIHKVKLGDLILLGAYYECESCGKKYDYEAGKDMKECPCG